MGRLTLINTLRAVIIFSFCTLAFSNVPVQASSTIFRVDPNGLEIGPCGESWENTCSLSRAISLSLPGDQIWITGGIYIPTNNGDRTISFALEAGEAWYGGFAGNELYLSQRDPKTNITVLSGDIGVMGDNTDNSYHVVYSNKTDATTILDGVTISGGNANGNYPNNRGGGIFNYVGSPSFINVTVIENSASDLGGGVYNYQGSPKYSDIRFESNVSENRGGGIFNYSSQVTMNDIIFNANRAKDFGGGMSNYSSQCILTTATFTNNVSETSGGAIYSFGGTINISKVYFSGNVARNGAGMYNSWYSDATLLDITFESNVASERAGGFYNYLSDATLIGVEFLGNSAQQHGGGMFAGDSNPILENVLFSYNSSKMNGGGLNNNASDPILTNVTFIGNTAINGGGMFNWDSSSPKLENVTFQGNTAKFRGGGIYSVTNSNIVLSNVEFYENAAQEYGGGIFIDSSTPSFNNVKFVSNTAQQRGGAIYLSGSLSTITNVSFSNNTSYDGGGVFASASDSTLTNVTFSDNASENRGGGFYNYLSELNFYNVTFSNNYTKTYGGAYFNADGVFHLTNGTFAANRADVYGGAIASDESSASILNSIFWDNSAESGGNQVYLFSGGQPLINDSVVENGCPTGADCKNIITSDPKLGQLNDYGGFTPTISIQEGSSAIDAGNNEICPPSDQRGIDRPQGSNCDIGAYEFEFDGEIMVIHSPGDDEKLTASKVTFEWNAVPGATLYAIRLSTDPDFNTTIFKTKTQNNYFFFDEILQYNHTYYWQIRPIFRTNKGTWSPVFWFSSMDPLESPTLTSPLHEEILDNAEVTFSWSAVENGTTYKILIASDLSFSNKVFKKKTMDLTLVNTLPKGKYYWRVRAFDSSGVKGPWSTPQMFKIIP